MLRRSSAALVAIAMVGALAAPSIAATQYIALSTSSLPSAQGWTFAASGSHSGAVESNVFNATGTLLDMNTIGQGFGVSGGSIFYQVSGIVTTSEVKQLRFTARCLQFEGSGGASNGEQTNAFGFTTGSVQYDISITPTRIYALGPSGAVAVAGTYDNSSAFHDYILDFTPGPTIRIYRDNVLLFTSSSGFAVAANRVFFGDGTGGGNSHVEIKSLSFLQGGVVAVEPTTWGKVKSLYR